MATVSAKEFGNWTDISRRGERLVGRDGNGMMYGEGVVRFDGGDMSHELGVSIRDQLYEITVMESAIAQCPQPGDDRLLELLTFDKIVLMTGELPERGGVLEAYPELEKFIGQIN